MPHKVGLCVSSAIYTEQRNVRQLANFTQSSMFFFPGVPALPDGWEEPELVGEAAALLESKRDKSLRPSALVAISCSPTADVVRREHVDGVPVAIWSALDLEGLFEPQKLAATAALSIHSAVGAIAGGWTCRNPTCLLSSPARNCLEWIMGRTKFCAECSEKVDKAQLNAVAITQCLELLNGALTLEPEADSLQALKNLGHQEIQDGILANTGRLAAVERRLEEIPRSENTSLADWLLQFPTWREAEAALRLLEHLWCFNDSHFKDMTSDLLSQLDLDLSGFVVAPLGRAGDSSYRSTYDALHAGHPLHRADSLKEALRLCRDKGLSGILMLDDCVMSGWQLKEIFDDYFDTEDRTGEYCEIPLSQEEQDVARGLDLRVLICIGTARTEETAESLGVRLHLNNLKVTVARRHDVSGCYQSGMPMWADSADRLEAAHAATRVGYELMHPGRRKSREEGWVQASALGYNGAQQLLAFRHNTPTATLTMLWGSGRVLSQPWKPLLVRMD